MAKKQVVQMRKQELVTQLVGARQTISQGRADLKNKLKVKNQVRRLVSKKPKAVFVGSILAGLALTLLLRRSKPKMKPAKTTGQMLLGWALTLCKPAAKAWLVSRAKTIATNRFSAARQSPGYPNEPDLLDIALDDAPRRP